MTDHQPKGVGPFAVGVFVLIALACGGYGGMLLQEFVQDSQEAPAAIQVEAPQDEGLLAELATLQEAERSLRAQNEVAQVQLNDLRVALAEREAEVTSLNEQLASMEAAPVALEEELARLEAELGHLDAELLTARERVAFLEERNRALSSDLELALSEAARARQLLEMSSAQRAAGALEPPPLASVPASLADVPAPPPPPAAARPEPVELRPVLEELLALAPDTSKGAIEDRLGLPVVLQSPARLELGTGPLVTVHRFDTFSGDLLTSELTVRASGAEELAAQVAAHLSEAMGEPLSGAAASLAIGGRLRFETGRHAAVLVLETAERLQLLVEHTGVAAAPIQVFRRDDASGGVLSQPAPLEVAEEPDVEPAAEDAEVDGAVD